MYSTPLASTQETEAFVVVLASINPALPIPRLNVLGPVSPNKFIYFIYWVSEKLDGVGPVDNRP